MKFMKDNSNIVVLLNNLNKFYPVYKNPKHRLKEFFFRKTYHKKFWALKDINLCVKKGEVVGIIGENGAGKSSLLKIISRTLAPSSGEVIVNGLVSPILELGMGFHPEFTGRENIFLSATLLGLSHEKIESILDKIIEFSELGDFIDQPIKTYSSGMYVRLAFSIATSVDPDILVIDEALSVGDSYFQKKSLDRILEFKENGKTIIFCSHNLYHITHICNRAIWLDKGRIVRDGNVFDVTAYYEEKCRQKQKSLSSNRTFESSNYPVRLETCKLNKESFKRGDCFVVHYSFDNPHKISIHFAFAIERSEDGVLCFATSTYHDRMDPVVKEKGDGYLIIENQPLLHGNYQIAITIMDETATLTYDVKRINFNVEKCEEDLGLFFINHKWKI